MKTQNLFSQSSIGAGWTEVTSGERNAIVFERLNQSYGAYEIRKNYDTALLKAFSGMALLIVLLSSFLFLSSLFKEAKELIPPVTNAEQIFILPKTIESEIPKAVEQPKIHSSSALNKNLIPVVTTGHKEDNKVILQTPSTNSSPTGTSTDTSGIISEIPSGKVRTEQQLSVDTLTHSVGDIGKIPCFPGGDEKLTQYLKNNLHIPQELIEMGGIKEKVGIAFVVDKDGSIINAMILQKGSRYIQLNSEAIRVVKKMPKWEPGMQNENPVKVQMVLPIRFEVK